MKKVLTVLIAALGFTGFANAQSSTTTSSTVAPAVMVATTSTTTETVDEAECYCCPKGDFCSSQPGKCALHYNIDLVKDGQFYCPMIDNVTGSTQGYCPGTGSEMKQMEATNCAGGPNQKANESSNNSKKDENNSQGEGNNSSAGTDAQTGE